MLADRTTRRSCGGKSLNDVLYVGCNMERRPIDKIVHDGIDLYRRFMPDVFGVESNAFQELLGTRFAEEFLRQGLVVSPALVNNSSPSKQVRIRRLGSLLAQRRIKFKRGSMGCQLLVQQLKDFPDPHTHDDGPDACEMMERLIRHVIFGGRDGDNIDMTRSI